MQVAVDPSMKIVEIFTGDPHFVTPEHIQTGELIKNVMALDGAVIIGDQSIAVAVQLPSGWVAVSQFRKEKPLEEFMAEARVVGFKKSCPTIRQK